MQDLILSSPHGPFEIRTYAPDAPVGPGLVWVHGGGFAAGDLDMPEADDVARRLAARGIAVVSVGYSLAPVPDAWATLSGGTPRDGVHYPVASDEVEAAFRWAAASDLATGAWAIGGASAGANLATGAALRLVHTAGPAPALVVLAYPTVHAEQSAPGAELRAALDADPAQDRFGPDAVRAMYENYLGAPLGTADAYAVPGLATAEQLAGFPPTLIVTADVDELRVSAEDFARTLREAGRTVDIVREPDAGHGYLNDPENPAGHRAVERFASRILASGS